MAMPCPNYVLVDDKRIYCESGEKGHEGTCYGNRSETEYKALVKWERRATQPPQRARSARVQRSS